MFSAVLVRDEEQRVAQVGARQQQEHLPGQEWWVLLFLSFSFFSVGSPLHSTIRLRHKVCLLWVAPLIFALFLLQLSAGGLCVYCCTWNCGSCWARIATQKLVCPGLVVQVGVNQGWPLLIPRMHLSNYFLTRCYDSRIYSYRPSSMLRNGEGNFLKTFWKCDRFSFSWMIWHLFLLV